MSIQAFFGIAAGVVQFFVAFIYVRDIVRGNAEPSRVTWWILALVNAITVASYYVSGARDTIWIPVAYTISFSIYALLSIRYGKGSWSVLDWICFLGAIISSGAWYVTGSSQAGLYLIIIADFFGLIPTIRKAYREPKSESNVAWTLATLGSLLNVFAVEKWTFAIALYPLYVLITNGTIAFPLLRNKKHDSSVSAV